MKMISNVAYCGFKCDECLAYLAKLDNNNELRRITLKKWRSPEYPLELKDINCDGCKAPDGIHFKFCGDCAVRICASQKGVETCAHCPETEPIIESVTGPSTQPSKELGMEQHPEPSQPETKIQEGSSKGTPTPTESTTMPKPPLVPDMKEASPQEDSIVRELSADIAHYQQQMEQLDSELEELRVDHEGEGRWLSTVDETKRIRAKSLQEELKKAKNDFKEVKKDLQSAEKRMKNEIKEAMNQINAQKKRIMDAEKNLKKRRSVLEKEMMK